MNRKQRQETWEKIQTELPEVAELMIQMKKDGFTFDRDKPVIFNQPKMERIGPTLEGAATVWREV